MKKLIVLLTLVTLGFNLKAANELHVASNKTGTELSYVIAGGISYFGQEARVIFNRIRMYMEDGVILTVPLRKVDAYSVDGKIFHRLPLVDKNGKERGTALLELVAERGDLRLYRHSSMDNSLGRWFEDTRGNAGMYFVYKEGEYHVSVDERNFRTVLPFFGVKTF